ncbi:MAG TPA: metallophosphoesterase, partial [Microthrixaceae bacterium]|nr:metallophosphoesterase [Microthrixaceae bacterium]
SESAVGQRLETLSDKLASLYSSALTADIDASTGETVVLHISDLHLNPIGVELARRIATSFEVDAVLDTGDTTSFGSPFEGRFADLIADFPVPYLFVAGNHDSPENRAAIGAASGVEAIHRRVVEVGGVRILGYDDPLVTTTQQLDREERDRIERAGGKQLAELAATERPDVIAVHNPVILDEVAGEAPVAVAGHLHRFALGARDGTLIAAVGSTGATGLGSLISETDQPYAAELLRFRDGKLVAIDRIEIVGTDGDLVVQRHSITTEDREADDADFIDTDVEEGTGSDEDEVPTSSQTSSPTTR